MWFGLFSRADNEEVEVGDDRVIASTVGAVVLAVFELDDIASFNLEDNVTGHAARAADPGWEVCDSNTIDGDGQVVPESGGAFGFAIVMEGKHASGVDGDGHRRAAAALTGVAGGIGTSSFVVGEAVRGALGDGVIVAFDEGVANLFGSVGVVIVESEDILRFDGVAIFILDDAKIDDEVAVFVQGGILEGLIA